MTIMRRGRLRPGLVGDEHQEGRAIGRKRHAGDAVMAAPPPAVLYGRLVMGFEAGSRGLGRAMNADFALLLLDGRSDSPAWSRQRKF